MTSWTYFSKICKFFLLMAFFLACRVLFFFFVLSALWVSQVFTSYQSSAISMSDSDNPIVICVNSFKAHLKTYLFRHAYTY